MLLRLFRIGAGLVLACFIISCGRAEAAAPKGTGPSTQAPFPASPSPENAGALAPAVVVVYSQPPSPYGGILLSSLRDPNGSDTDQWAWDAFKFAWTQSITEIRWRGAYDPARLGSGGPVVDFTVEIYPSIASGTEPDLAHPPLARYELGSNADETAADVLASVQTYDYRYSLPAPFEAAAGAKYWVQIEAFQAGYPDWGLWAGTNGDGVYFRRVPGTGPTYQVWPGDAAFTLLAPSSGAKQLYLPLLGMP